MATTMISPAGELGALDHYVGNISAKDLDSPEPTERAEYCSTIGDCTSENFVDRVRENARRQGKSHLKHEAYHVILSQTHEEADPRDPQAGHRQHVMARALIKKKFPGHMAKLITQRDNGRWGEVDGERVWEPGKWHTHAIIANVSSREAVLELVDKDGTVSERRYKAGRAIDGAMKDIHAIRHGTDELVLEHLGYDNAAYVEACRKASAGRGARATTRDMADRRDHGYSSHDEVRVRLREARALATSWDDYTARLEADAVWTRVTGKSGVSYAWVGADGIEHAASARSRKGRDGLGNDFTMTSVTEQCAVNAERVAQGETLEAPERAMVPAPPAPTERPVPVYLTPDGRPPWERELDDYAERVRESGGTYEQQARERIDFALEDAWVTDRDRLIVAAPDHGIEVDGRIDEPLIALDTTDGRIAFEAGHLGDEYSGDHLDRRFKTRRKDKDCDHDRGARSAPERATGGRSAADAGTRIERIDGAAIAALQSRTNARIIDERAKRHVDSSERTGHCVDVEGRRPDGAAERSGREANQPDERGRGPDREGGRGRGQASSDTHTPIRDRAVQRESERAGDGSDRERS
ncbi:hypothetical protein [Gordonia amicalis]|uniref:hypothetical protein n=1 Tax=Gordonia amicalis TaxID=89053 RepID=UPI0024B9266D|nr:hypothetical protein [Gordonia amicalis]MDJ0454073.1 hypothetical protein [Gordonia amicalis]MDV7077217.1 hypothetical protein [Gordonia amicalis]